MTPTVLTPAAADRLLARPVPRGTPSLSYRRTERSAVVGRGLAAFDRAADVLLHWGVQERAGLVVQATSPEVAPGVVVRQGFGVGPARLWAPCEVTDLWRESTRAGFTYRALGGHPEQGVETFVLTLDPDGAVLFRVSARSRPGTWWTAAGLPLMRFVQRRIVARYLRALRE